MSASAQVALTAATRQHLGLCIFCCVNACIHCAGAGIALNVMQCISLSCNISLSSLVTVCNAMMSRLGFCQRQVSGRSFCCAKFLFQTGAFFFLPLAQRCSTCAILQQLSQKGSCYFLQLSGGARNGCRGECVSQYLQNHTIKLNGQTLVCGQ